MSNEKSNDISENTHLYSDIDQEKNPMDSVSPSVAIANAHFSKTKKLKFIIGDDNPSAAEIKSLKEFLAQHTCDVTANATHTAFSGICLGVKGPFEIPETDQSEFWRLYCKAVQKWQLVNLIELKPLKKWVFFMDIDTSEKSTPTIDQDPKPIVEILKKQLPETFKQAFGKREAYEFEFQEKSTKPGRNFHVFCTSHRIIVDTETAAAIRDHLLDAMLKQTNLPHKELSKFIDAVMSSTTGFRMYGSR